MNRLIAMVVGAFLSVLLVAPVNAVSDGRPGNRQDGKQGQIKQAPKAAKAWHEKEKKRYEVRKRAAKMKQKQMSNQSGG